MTTTTKRPHYVPKFYLDYFLPDLSSGAKTFWVYNKDGGAPRPQTPINTAVEGGFYSFETLPGAGDDPMERKVFGPIEQGAKPILDRWQLPGARLQSEDVPKMAAFLAFMHTRVPRAMQMVKEINEAGAIQALKNLASNPERLRESYDSYKKMAPDRELPPFEELRQSMMDVDINYKIAYDPKAALLQSIEMAGHICDQLLKMYWSLCTIPSGGSFITGDAPLVVFLQTGPKQAIFGGGLGLAQVQVFFPVSPTVGLFLSRRRPQRYWRVSDKFVREMNRRTVWNAEKYVISTYKTNQVAAWIKEASITRTLPKIDGAAIAERFKTAGV